MDAHISPVNGVDGTIERGACEDCEGGGRGEKGRLEKRMVVGEREVIHD